MLMGPKEATLRAPLSDPQVTAVKASSRSPSSLGPVSSSAADRATPSPYPHRQRRSAMALYGQEGMRMSDGFGLCPNHQTFQQYDMCNNSSQGRQRSSKESGTEEEMDDLNNKTAEEALIRTLSSSQDSIIPMDRQARLDSSVLIRLGKPLQLSSVRAFFALGKMAFLSDLILEVQGRMAIQPCGGCLGHLAGCSMLRKLDISFLPIPPGEAAAISTSDASDDAGGGGSQPWVLTGGVVVVGARSGLGRLDALKCLEVLTLRGSLSVGPCGFEALAGLGQVTALTLWTKAS